VEDGAGLRDAFLVAGQLNISTSGTLEVAFDPTFHGDQHQVVTLVDATISHYATELGSLGPTRVFVQSSSALHQDVEGLGRRGGFVLRLPETSRNPNQVALLVLHEALHLWNGHHLVADPQQEAELRWFIEGITHYSALMAGCQTGFYGQRFVLDELAAIFDAYLRNPITAQNVGTSLDQRRYPYDHGALIGFFVEILGHQNGVQSLQWISALQKIAPPPQKFRITDVEAALRTIVGEPELRTLLPLMRPHESTVPVTNLLAKSGLHLLRSSRDTPARLIPLENGPATYKNVLKTCKDDL
jgi:predicted metalloprotease with PDZ domain